MGVKCGKRNIELPVSMQTKQHDAIAGLPSKFSVNLTRIVDGGVLIMGEDE